MELYYPDALDYFVDQSRTFIGENDPQVIVIHGTGGNAAQTAQQLGEFFRNNGDRTSVHIGIDRAGVVAQYVRFADGAGGNCCVEPGYDPFWQPYLNKYGNLNKCTLSIEHVNDLTNSLALTVPQKLASFKTVAWMCRTFNISFDRIKSHASIAPKNRSHCPGNYPWDELFTFLNNGGSMSGVPTGWQDNGKELTAKNGIKVVLGFRDYVLSHDWNPNNQPLEPEHGQSPLLLSNPTLGGGTQQLFDDLGLGWTPSTGMFEIPAGRELLKQRALLADTQNQLSQERAKSASLQAQIDASKAQPPNSTGVDKQALSSILQELQPFVSLANEIEKVVGS